MPVSPYQIDQVLRDARITVADSGDQWLMTMVRPGHKPKGPYRVRVRKADVPAERIKDHARLTFAMMLL